MSGTRVPASEDTQGVIGATGRLDNDVLIFTCVAPRTKKCHFADFLHKSTTGSTSTGAFFLYDIPRGRTKKARKQQPGALRHSFFQIHIHLCCTAHKNNAISPIFCTNLPLEARLPVHFSRTTLRHSATTSVTLLIRKCTTR